VIGSEQGDLSILGEQKRRIFLHRPLGLHSFALLSGRRKSTDFDRARFLSVRMEPLFSAFARRVDKVSIYEYGVVRYQSGPRGTTPCCC
jgi:hypothetical protein